MHVFMFEIDVFSTDASTSISSVPSFISNGMTGDIHFFTRSTTSTKNTYKIIS